MEAFYLQKLEQQRLKQEETDSLAAMMKAEAEKGAKAKHDAATHRMVTEKLDADRSKLKDELEVRYAPAA